jgi:hypothetical protein
MMKESSAKTDRYPVAVPPDLLGQVRQASQKFGLSMADIVRQNIRLPLPKLRRRLSPVPLKNLKPLWRAESRRCHQQPKRDFDALEHHLAGLPSPLPEVR